MKEETTVNPEITPEDPAPDNQIYLDQIAELKKNSVSRAAYDKLAAENKNLLRTIVEGSQPEPSGDPEPPKPTIEEIRKRFKPSMTNLEAASAMLDLRDRVIEEGGVDPFVAQIKVGSDNKPLAQPLPPDPASVESAERLAEILRDCVDNSKGDPALFTALLQNRMI